MIVEAVAADVLASHAIAGSGTIASVGAEVLKRLLSRRIERARDVLVEEISRGTKSLHDLPEDELAAIAYRYMRAATEGVARLNLRLLASTARGQADGPGLYADEFHRWADVIANLRREELIVLAEVHRQTALHANEDNSAMIAWRAAIKALETSRYSEEVVELHASACLRTGLLRLKTGYYGGGQAYVETPLLQTFMSLADVEGVMARDHQAP